MLAAVTDPIVLGIGQAFTGSAQNIGDTISTVGPTIVGVLSALLGARWVWRKFTAAASH